MKRSNTVLKYDWSLPGVFKPLGAWMNAVARRLSRVVVYGGQGEWTPDGLKLYIWRGFTGIVYLAGVKFTGLGTKEWVRARIDVGIVEDHDGPPPDPFPPGEEWYEVASTVGDIHITRFG